MYFLLNLCIFEFLFNNDSRIGSTIGVVRVIGRNVTVVLGADWTIILWYLLLMLLLLLFDEAIKQRGIKHLMSDLLFYGYHTFRRRNLGKNRRRRQLWIALLHLSTPFTLTRSFSELALHLLYFIISSLLLLYLFFALLFSFSQYSWLLLLFLPWFKIYT